MTRWIASSIVPTRGAKPPSSPTDGGEAVLLEVRLERVEHLDARAQRFGEARRAERDDHELLHFEAVVGVSAAVQDVHERRGQRARVGAAEVAPQRQPTVSAAARATAIETPSIAFAPSFDLVGVPSACKQRR